MRVVLYVLLATGSVLMLCWYWLCAVDITTGVSYVWQWNCSAAS